MYLGPGKPNGGGVRVLPLDRPDEVEVMAAFRPELPYVYPEDVVIGTSDAGGTGAAGRFREASGL